jgi:PAS domain S-box-containing protein
MQRLVDGFDDPAYVVDWQMAIVAWNHAVEQQLGVAAEEVIGRNAYEALRVVCTPALRAERIANLRQNLRWVGATLLESRRGRRIPFGGFCHPVWKESPPPESPRRRGLKFLTVLSPFQNAGIGHVRSADLDVVVSRVVAAYELKSPANSENLTREPLTREPYTGAIPELGSDSVPVTTPIPPTIQLRLRQARERAGLTVYALANLTGVQQYQIRTWEMAPSDSRSHKISPENLAKLLPHIGGTSDYYFYGAEDGKP